MAMTPGTYLRKRREAAGKTVELVMAEIGTVPRIAELDRQDWLRRIEADQAPIGTLTAAALSHAIRFDFEILEQLTDLYECNADLPEPQLCRVCACSYMDPCMSGLTGCHWEEPDLCSHCAPAARVAAGGAAR